MRVAITTTYSPWDDRAGLAQRSAAALAEALATEGIDTSVVFTMEGHSEPTHEASTGFRERWAPLLRAVHRRGGGAMSEHAAPTAWALRELNDEAALDVVHGHGEEMALVSDAVSDAVQVISSHRAEPGSPVRLRHKSEVLVCKRSLRKSLEQAHAVVVATASDMRATMVSSRIPWERVVAIEQGISQRFLVRDNLFASGLPTHLLVVGGSGDDTASCQLLEALGSMRTDGYLPICWIDAFGRSPASRSKNSRQLRLPPGVERLGVGDERSLQRLIGRASAVIILDSSDISCELLRVAIAMGKRVVLSDDSERCLVTPLEPLHLPRLPREVSDIAELIRASSRHQQLRSERFDELSDFAAKHFAWKAVAQRHIELYERVMRSGDESASPSPDSL